MPWESIGSVDTGELPDDAAWIEEAQTLAIFYIEAVCGKAPDGCKLGIMSHDHDYGTYTTLGVHYEFFEPQEYIRNAEDTLDLLNSAVDWYMLKEHFYRLAFTEESDED